MDQRTREALNVLYRCGMYSAICRGDLDGAEDFMNLLYLNGVDRGCIESARAQRVK